MSETSNSDRWKSDGKCSLCRRKEYCSKPCTAHKRRVQADIFQTMDSATGGMLSYMTSKFKIGR
jgi:radical SAM protein with 4Fe4S-binding SPASM domain